jgi:Ca2+-binding RTX toxin-like protein
MRRVAPLVVAVLAAACLSSPAVANHILGGGCTNCASHAYWPHIDGVLKIARTGTGNFFGTARSDELLGHHGSDHLRGRGGSDVLWGDYDPNGQPASQVDYISGGAGTDFIYGSHGRNVISGGPGNDAISVHYGRGIVDCGPGRDIYHVARSRKKGYRFRNCEKVDYRPEKVRGGGLKPLP